MIDAHQFNSDDRFLISLVPLFLLWLCGLCYWPATPLSLILRVHNGVCYEDKRRQTPASECICCDDELPAAERTQLYILCVCLKAWGGGLCLISGGDVIHTSLPTTQGTSCPVFVCEL